MAGPVLSVTLNATDNITSKLKSIANQANKTKNALQQLVNQVNQLGSAGQSSVNNLANNLQKATQNAQQTAQNTRQLAQNVKQSSQTTNQSAQSILKVKRNTQQATQATKQLTAQQQKAYQVAQKFAKSTNFTPQINSNSLSQKISNAFGRAKQTISNGYNNLRTSTLGLNTYAGLSQLKNKITGSKIGQGIGNIFGNLTSKISNSSLGQGFGNLASKISNSSLGQGFGNFFSNIKSSLSSGGTSSFSELQNAFSSVVAAGKNVIASFQPLVNLVSTLSSGISKLASTVTSLGSAFGSTVGNVANFTSNISGVRSTLGNIGSSLLNATSKASIFGNGFGTGFSALSDTGSGIGGTLSKITSSFGNFMKVAVGLRAVNGMVSTVTNSFGGALDRADTFTTFNRKMELITGSSDQAQIALNNMNNATRGTAYGLTTAATALQNFVVRGMSVDDASKSVSTWMDVVSAYGDGTSETLQTVTDAVAKMRTKGTVEMKQLNRLFENGINPVETYAKAVGMSAADVQEALSNKEIRADEFLDVVERAYREGTNGVVAVDGFAKKVVDTWAGTIANMKIAVTRGALEIINGVDAIVSAFTGLDEGGLKLIFKNFGLFAEDAMGSVGKVLTGIGKGANIIGDAVRQNLEVLTPRVEFLDKKLESLRTKMNLNFEVSNTMVSEYLQSLAQTIKSDLSNDIVELKHNAQKAFLSIGDSVALLIPPLVKVSALIGVNIVQSFVKLSKKIVELTEGVIPPLIDCFTDLLTYLSNNSDYIQEFFNNVNDIIEDVGNVINLKAKIMMKLFKKGFDEGIGQDNLFAGLIQSFNKVIESFNNGISKLQFRALGETFGYAVNIFSRFINFLGEIAAITVKIKLNALIADLNGLNDIFAVISHNLSSGYSIFDILVEAYDNFGSVVVGIEEAIVGITDVVFPPIFDTLIVGAEMLRDVLAHCKESISTFNENIEPVKQGFSDLAQSLSYIFQTVIIAFEPVANAIFDSFLRIIETISVLGSQFTEALTNHPEILESIKNIGTGIAEVINKITSCFEGITKLNFGKPFDRLLDTVSEVLKFVEDFIDTISKSRGTIDVIAECVGNIFDNISRVLPLITASLGMLFNSLMNDLFPVIAYAVQGVISFLVQLGGVVIPAVATVITGICKTIKMFAPAAIVLLEGLLLGFLAFKALSFLGNIITTIGSFIRTLGFLRDVIMSLNFAFLLNPITWVIAGIVAVVLAFIWAYNNIEWFRDGVNAAFEAIGGFFSDLGAKLGGFCDGVREKLSGWAEWWNNIKLNNSWIQPIEDFISVLGAPFRVAWECFTSGGDEAADGVAEFNEELANSGVYLSEYEAALRDSANQTHQYAAENKSALDIYKDNLKQTFSEMGITAENYSEDIVQTISRGNIAALEEMGLSQEEALQMVHDYNQKIIDDSKITGEEINEDLANSIHDIANSIADGSSDISDKVKQFGETFAKDMGQVISNGFIEGMQTAQEAVIAETTELMTAVTETMVTNIENGFGQLSEKVTEKFSEMNSKVCEELTITGGYFQRLFNDISVQCDTYMNQVKDTFTNTLTEMSTVAEEKMETIKNTITDKFEEAKNNAKTKVTNMQTEIYAIFVQMANDAYIFGYDISRRLGAGIQDGGEVAINAAYRLKSSVENILNSISANVSIGASVSLSTTGGGGRSGNIGRVASLSGGSSVATIASLSSSPTPIATLDMGSFNTVALAKTLSATPKQVIPLNASQNREANNLDDNGNVRPLTESNNYTSMSTSTNNTVSDNRVVQVNPTYNVQNETQAKTANSDLINNLHNILQEGMRLKP